MELTLQFQNRDEPDLVTFRNEVNSLCDAGLRAQVMRRVNTPEKQEIFHLIFVCTEKYYDESVELISQHYFEFLKLPKVPDGDLDDLFELLRILDIQFVEPRFRGLIHIGEVEKVHCATVIATRCIEKLQQHLRSV